MTSAKLTTFKNGIDLHPNTHFRPVIAPDGICKITLHTNTCGRKRQETTSLFAALGILRWIFHFTPTSCSRINAVGVFFWTLARRRLRRGVRDSIEQVETSLLDFIELHNGK